MMCSFISPPSPPVVHLVSTGISGWTDYQGLPNLFLPLNMAAGEFRKGEPLACVETPPGSKYAPGPEV